MKGSIVFNATPTFIYGSKIKVVRLSNLFGDNFTKQSTLLPSLIRKAVKEKKINIFVNRKSSKDYLDVNEALSVLFKIINKGKYRLYNIAYGKNIELYKITTSFIFKWYSIS